MDWLNAAVTLGSGLLGAQSSKQGTSTTSENKLDPRMDRFVYGADGQSGLLGSAFDLAQQQLTTGGLNDMQRQGMDMQRQYLMSPQYQQGFGNMSQLGQSLMGGGVAGNPFTGGQAVRGAAPAPAFNYSGAMNAQMPDFKLQPSMLTPENTKAVNGLLGGNGGFNGGGGDRAPGTPYGGIGTGQMTDAINAQMKETFQSYIAMGLTPAAAIAAVQSVMANRGVLGAVNEAADPIGALNAIQGWTTADTSYDPYGGGVGGGWGSGMGADGHGGALDGAMGGGFDGGGWGGGSGGGMGGNNGNGGSGVGSRGNGGIGD